MRIARAWLSRSSIAPGATYNGQPPESLYTRYRDNFFATSNNSPASNPAGVAGGIEQRPTASADARAPDATSPDGTSSDSGNLGAELLQSGNPDPGDTSRQPAIPAMARRPKAISPWVPSIAW